MPEITMKQIVSFSSEDKVHRAENLIKPETYRKWKCASPGEKNASVVIQFEKASEINSIDIGNESSAFVEVLVGRSSNAVSDFQVLLVASSFMSPIESRNETHTNRVRMFGPEKLAQNIKNEKWDCVQVVCTQPFNKNITYGLSFIKFHGPPEKIEERPKSPEKATSKMGSFILINEDDEDSVPSVGSFFGKKKNESFQDVSKTNSQDSPSYASMVLASSQSPKTASESSASKRRLSSPESNTPKRPPALNKIFVTYKDIGVDKEAATKAVQSLIKSDNSVTQKQEETKKPKPFNKVMNKVVFVLSGFVNPLRSQIRDKALEMGAKYKGDWDDSCTHLICAFINTPKYIQVRSCDGRVVSKEWILDCHKKKTLLPWREYMLGKYSKDTSSDSSEDDEPEVKTRKQSPSESFKKTASKPQTKSPPSKPSNVKDVANLKQEPKTSDSETEDEDALADYVAVTDVDSDSGGDTEGELRKAEMQIKRRAAIKHSAKISNGNSRSNSSPPKKPDISNLPLPELPNLFKKKHFYLFGKFSPSVYHDVQRFITAYNGVIENYMSGTVKYVITEASWDENFDNAVSENEDLVFVKPKWIYRCHESQKFVPYQPFLIVPDM